MDVEPGFEIAHFCAEFRHLRFEFNDQLGTDNRGALKNAAPSPHTADNQRLELALNRSHPYYRTISRRFRRQ
jgi:hypothetical protein